MSTNEAPPPVPSSRRLVAGSSVPASRSARSLHGHPGGDHASSLRALVLAALGIVFGDIGTSPLYTLRECVTVAESGGMPAEESILGVLSMMIWSLVMVVSVKYLGFVMKADNHGEGGILSLLALVPEHVRAPKGAWIGWVTVLVLIGGALLYGDGIITPCISVLGAVEGLEMVTESFEPVVVPLTCGLLIALFSIQRFGTARVGKLFGPVILVWFVALFGLGAYHVVQNPAVLAALSPHHAARFLAANGLKSLTVLGAVVLAVTGAEALYADMGHLGARSIRVAWWTVVMPGLVMNYLGQGALLLAQPEALKNPFFALVPNGPARYALIGLATLASIIASQAVITGAYSLTRQAAQLGYFPRVTVKHTSYETEGQIYVPQINWALCVVCLFVVLEFRDSSSLASAYGLAVTGTMTITSIVYFVVVRSAWRWPLWKAVPLVALFLAFDVPFLVANLLKFLDRGYVPVLIAAVVLCTMLTWRRGRLLLAEYIVRRSPPMDEFLVGLSERLVARIPGTGVFMASNSGRVPPILFHHAQRLRVLHDTVILFTVVSEHVPVVAEEDRLEVVPLGQGIHRVIARCGFMEVPAVPELLAEAASGHALPAELGSITYYLGRETFVASGGGKMGRWSEAFFAFLARNAQPATAYFGIPHEQVVELGTQIDL